MRIYIAGKISDPDAKNILENIGVGIRAGIKVLKKGHIPFIPHMDYSMWLMQTNTFTEDDIKKMNLEWVKQCHGILILSNAYQETNVDSYPYGKLIWLSKGVKTEYTLAVNLKMKIYWSLKEIPDNK